MTFNLSTSALQDISVKCVALFMNKHASLSGAVSDEAKALELNPEQIKRVIETTNTLAYLRQLKDAEDRTFEFPVANYTDVMGRMVLPEKQAMEAVGGSSGDGQTSIGEEQESTIHKYNLDAQEKRAMLAKETFRCKQVLVKMAEDKVGVHSELISKAGNFSKDKLALEKLAEVVEEDDFAPLVKLLGLEKTAADVGKEVFLDSELNEARALYSFYKEAKDLVSREEELGSFVKRAAATLFNKDPDSLFSKALNRTGQAIGTGLGASVSGPVKGISQGIKHVVMPDASKGFAATAKHQGYKSTKDAIDAYDKLKSGGVGAEVREFNGAKPSYLAHRLGIGGIAGKAMLLGTGASVEHNHNVWDELN